MKKVLVTGCFDDLRSSHVRFLEEASKFGNVHILLWSDEAQQALAGKVPKFPQAERLYLLQAVRYVFDVKLVALKTEAELFRQIKETGADCWVLDEASDHPQKRIFCESIGMEYKILKKEDYIGFSILNLDLAGKELSRKKVVVTGCFDWLHSGHVRFFEEVSELGNLFVVVGSDENVRFLKGKEHPMFHQDERRYMVQSIRFVKQALISSGHGWLDAEPEISRIRPDIYAVNEDGDRPEKRSFCAEQGIHYLEFKRIPREGLPKRESKDLRGY